MENKTILITGACGFIGSHLVETIARMNPKKIIGVDNFISGSRANLEYLSKIPNFEFIEQDISDKLEIAEGIDFIFNFACPASPTDFEKLRIDIVRTGSIGDFNMLELARIKDATYIYASSSEVYGDALVNPQNEDYNGNVNINGVRSVYDENKRFGETMAMAFHREYGLKTRIVRIFNTYGERMRHNDGRSTPTFIDQAIRSEDITIFGDGSQTRSPQYVSDLVDGVIKLALSDVSVPVNIGNPQELTMNELAHKIIEITGSKSKIVYKPLPEHDPKLRKPDITRAKELLGWEPKVSLEEGLKKTIDWFSKNI